MKIAIIGGAGTRTPLLVYGMARSGLPIHRLSLYDVDAERLPLMARLAQKLAGTVPVQPCPSLQECVEGADFVFTSIRVGGIERRAEDEAAILRHGIVGQETVGPGGFAMALRTIPHMVAYARLIAAAAPGAWIINFTNPVGIITQAVLQETGARILGICDSPTELFHEVAQSLGLEYAECHFDYFGLNHLGWLRQVYRGGEAQLERLWDEPARLRAVYRTDLFEAKSLAELKLLPTEYLYYYYRPQAAREHILRSGTTRGAVIQALNARLFEELCAPGTDAVVLYEEYLTRRNASYMQIESGGTVSHAASPWSAVTGYDRIALTVVQAVHHNSGAIIPLNVRNGSNLPFLEPGDTVEVPCVVNSNGALPLSVEPVPLSVRPLIMQVKEYERLTIQAALGGDPDLMLRALISNPLVPDAATARILLSDLGLT